MCWIKPCGSSTKTNEIKLASAEVSAVANDGWRTNALRVFAAEKVAFVVKNNSLTLNLN